MAINIDLVVPEFNGDDFMIWEIKMKIFLICNDMWEIVEKWYEELECWSNLEGEEKRKNKEDQYQNYLTLLDLMVMYKIKYFSSLTIIDQPLMFV